MKRILALAWIVLSACSGPGPREEGRLAPEDRSRFARAVEAVISGSAISVRFHAGASEPDGTRRTWQGRIRWYRGGIVLLNLRRPGADEERILRIGPDAWDYEPSTGAWKPRKDAAGSGYQNVFELLAGLLRILERASPVDSEAVDGVRCRGCMLAWDEDSRGATLAPFGFGFTEAFNVRLILLADDEAVRRIRLKAESPYRRTFAPLARADATLEIESFGAPSPMTFEDVPIPFSPEMNAAVRKAGGPGPEPPPRR